MIKSNYLENLRAKPEPVRRRIAIVVSAALTALVVGIWLINLSVGGTAPVTPTSPSLSLFDHLERVRTGLLVVVESLRSYLP